MSTPPASPESAVPPPDGEVVPRRSRKRRILKWTAISLASLLVLIVALGVADYFYLNGKITKVGTFFPAGTKRPQKIATKAANFVLIGSDTRAGANGKGTGREVAGARSDTTILLHISANDSGATLVSIPRDSYVHIPSCVIGSNGQTSQPTVGKFNEAYSIGTDAGNKYGPSCTVHTIETLTGIHIDHFAVVDFTGFEKMVSALGGVRMCVAKPLYDPVVNVDGAWHGSGLNLPAGKSVEINGTQALALMRARYNLDGGGDLPRIKRQQEFIGAMIRKATSTSLLINPVRLQEFLSAAASSLTTDGFGLGTMKQLASALHSVGAGGVKILTVPTLTEAPGLPYGDVLWDPSKAPALWAAIRNDQPLPGTTHHKSSTAGPKLTVPPSAIDVAVENGTGQQGVAHAAANALTSEGFNVVSVGNAAKSTYTSTVVEYGSTKVQSSQTVAAAIPGAVRQADPTAGDTITVILGSSYSKVVPVTVSTPSPDGTATTASLGVTSASKEGCLS